ncbi:MAG: hypothetical protein AAF702_39560 [Chloroflexota bacterium]
MTEHRSQRRRQTYFRLSSQLAQIDTAQLRSLLKPSEPHTGRGHRQTVTVGDTTLFVKRIPVTDLERDNMFSTKNVYDLPTYYNFCFGSVGFNVYRELITHIKTTNWVLNGEIASFPLLYHYRVVPFLGERTPIGPGQFKDYVEACGGDENIGRYMLDRANANAELFLFLGYIPNTLHLWLLENLEQIDWVLDELGATLDFLEKNGIIHDDAHFGNVLTDGESIYVTDFGIILDKSFDLQENEKEFFAAHTHLSYGMFLLSLFPLVKDKYEALPASAQQRIREELGLQEQVDNESPALFFATLDNIEKIYVEGLMKLDKAYVDCMVRFRDIIRLMAIFFIDMWDRPKKDGAFPNAELQQLLKETSFISDTEDEYKYH